MSETLEAFSESALSLLPLGPEVSELIVLCLRCFQPGLIVRFDDLLHQNCSPVTVPCLNKVNVSFVNRQS